VKRTGCGQVVVIGSMLLWLGAVLVGVMFLTDSASGVAVTVAIAVAAVVVLLPFVGVALLTRRRAGWEATAAAASGFVTTAGYFLLDVAMRAMSPEGSIPAAPLSLQVGGALRLGVLFPYALLAAWLAPHLAGASRRRLWEWLGLNRFDLPTLLLSLAVAALVTVPWPVTGALGDSLTSLSLVFQALVWAIPLVLIFWGVIFCLLTSTFARPWAAALTTIVLYGLSMLSGVLPVADWGVLEDGIYLLPMALLLTELRARECGIYPLLLVAFCYRVAPLLFMDPRDVIVNGAPEPQHIVSYRIVVMTVSALSIALWSGRRLLLLLRGRVQVSAWIWAAGATFVMLVVWGAWGGLYVFAGEPGFTNDGFLIILEEQAGGSTALAEVLRAAYAIPDREVRSQYVYETMVEVAGRTQAPLRAELDALGVSYRPYYIINMIRVDGHRWLMRHFEGRPGVAQVLLNPNVREYPRSVLSSYGGDGEPFEEVQPNLAAIHADEAWAMGVTGEGIVVAGQDTGYDWTHPALKSH